jgi:hypothetical protein
MSHSDNQRYESLVEVVSERLPGVRFRVERMSFGRRLELVRQLKDLLARLEFLQAAPQSPAQQAEATLVAGEVDRIYLRWGLRSVEGLEIDGQPATPEALLERGPEPLVDEALAAIRREAGLSEAERKNSRSPSISSSETRPDGSATIAAV